MIRDFKQKLADILILTLFVSILCLAGFGVSAVKTQSDRCHYPETSQEKAWQYERGQESFWQRLTNDPIAIFTLVEAMVAGGQLWLFWWQLDLIRSGGQDTKIAANAALRAAVAAEKSGQSDRAWVILDGVNIDFSKNACVEGVLVGDGIQFSVRWVNAGKTPALKCNSWIDFRIVEKNISDPVFISDVDSNSRKILGQGKTVNTAEKFVPKTDVLCVKNETHVLWLYSAFEYCSIFNQDEIKISETCGHLCFRGIQADAERWYFFQVGAQNSCT